MSGRPLIVRLPGADVDAEHLAGLVGGEVAALACRSFPDGETYLRYDDDPAGRPVVIVGSLDRPDPKAMPLLFAAQAARDLGASQVGLVAPYLAYMRQDTRFQPGEAVTSRWFARFLSSAVDWLITVDPHLHRYHALDEIYAVPCEVAHAAPELSRWIRSHVERPLLVGPDVESEQWVAMVARGAEAPYLVLHKTRHGDREVEIERPDVTGFGDRTPVLVDDIIATGRTMIGTVTHLRQAGLAAPVCVGVHAVFAEDAYQALSAAGAGKIVTTNTIRHPSNAIDLDPILADRVKRRLEQIARPS